VIDFSPGPAELHLYGHTVGLHASMIVSFITSLPQRPAARGVEPSARGSLAPVNAALWSRQPDEWDKQWEQEENARRQNRQKVGMGRLA
jgi:hypothetical protein